MCSLSILSILPQSPPLSALDRYLSHPPPPTAFHRHHSNMVDGIMSSAFGIQDSLSRMTSMTNSISPPHTQTAPGDLFFFAINARRLFIVDVCKNRSGREEEARRQSHQAADERVHGVVADEATTNSTRKPKDA